MEESVSTDPEPVHGKIAPVSSEPHDNALDRVACVPLIVFASTALIGLSLVLTLLSAAGHAQSLPMGLRAMLVCLVAVTLPGLPIAALLRLPSNGIFGSVAIAISVATNVLLAQTNYLAELHQAYLFQFLQLAIAVAATSVLAREWYRHRHESSMSSILSTIRRRFPSTGNRALSGVLMAATLVLFATAVARLETGSAGRFGLLESLGIDYFIGIGVIGVVLAIEYGRVVIDRLMLAVANVTLVFYIVMPVALVDRTASFVTAYVHRFIANWISTLDTLPPPLDARISWAGFFSAVAHLMTVGGLDDSDVFVVGAPLLFGVLLMIPIYAIGRSITGNERAAWLGVTVYVLFNWYQQDYFAPQAIAMQLYTAVIAVLLWQLGSANVPTLAGGRMKRFWAAWMRIPGRVAGRDGRWTQAVELTLVLIIAAIVVSHQLTPVVTLAALLVFSVLGLTRYKLLGPVTVLLFVAWFVYGAYAFWQGHLGQILSDIGGVDENVSMSVSVRLSGDPVYSRMQYLRMAASLLLFVSAAVGWLRMPRGISWLLIGMLAVLPFGLVALQSYGGEVLIRCFLYASALLAPLAALALLPLLSNATGRPGLRLRHIVISACLFSVLAVWCVTNRGLNTSFEHTTQEELGIADQLVGQVRATTDIGYWGQGAFYGMPMEFEIDAGCMESARLLAECTAQQEILYLIESDQDEKFLQYRSGVDREILVDAMEILTAEHGFVMVYRGEDVRVLRRTGAPQVNLGTDR